MTRSDSANRFFVTDAGAAAPASVTISFPTADDVRKIEKSILMNWPREEIPPQINSPPRTYEIMGMRVSIKSKDGEL